jgi:hypothetical protein
MRLSPRHIATLALGGAALAIACILLLVPKPWEISSLDKIRDIGSFYVWWAAAINLVPLFLLLVTAGFWTKSLDTPPAVAAQASPGGFFLVVGAAMLAFAVLAGMRLQTSLWDDEDYAARRAILGTYRVRDDGSVKLKELRWSDTLWYYTKPTNHVFQSILARLSLSAWRAVARPEGLQVSEPAIRFPSYVGGILGVGTLALLMAQAGFAWEGALGAWLLALHPWFLRLAPEARGYGLVFFLIPLACLLAMRALDDGRWRWWLGLAAAEFALLYTWPPALIVLLVLNVGVLVRLFTDEYPSTARGIFLARWLVSGIAAAMLFFQLFLPCIPQFRAYIGADHSFNAVLYWLKNVGSLMFTGALWSKTGSLVPPYPETWPDAAAHPVLFGVAVGLALALAAFGAVRLWRSGARGRCLAAVFLLPGPLMFGLAVLRQKYLYEWYVAFMLPGLAALAGAGILGVCLGRQPWVRWCAAGAALAVFVVITTQGREFLLTRSAQPIRESVLLCRPSLDPGDPRNAKILTASSVVSPEVYDPLVRRATSLEKYRAIMQEADARGVPFYVNNGFPLALRVKFPAIAAMLADRNLFEPVAYLFAIEGMLDREVHRYRAGSVAEADWERYRKAVAPPKPDGVLFYY